MTNYSALGIDKEMGEEFDNYNPTILQQLTDSCYFDNPHKTNRKEGASYCIIEVNDCQNDSWWYSKLIGHQFFCRINFHYNTTNIKEFIGVKLTKNHELIFRGFDPKDVSII